MFNESIMKGEKRVEKSAGAQMPRCSAHAAKLVMANPRTIPNCMGG